MNKLVDNHNDRIVKLENQTMKHDRLHKQTKQDIDDILARLGKIENKGGVRAALEAAGDMPDDKIDLILKAIDDMSDNIVDLTDKKLDNYIKRPEFSDLNDFTETVGRRCGHNEGAVKDLDEKQQHDSGMIEGNRKKI